MRMTPQSIPDATLADAAIDADACNHTNTVRPQTSEPRGVHREQATNTGRINQQQFNHQHFNHQQFNHQQFNHKQGT